MPGGVFAFEVMSPHGEALGNGRAWLTDVETDSVTMFVSAANPLTQQMRMCHFTVAEDGSARLRGCEMATSIDSPQQVGNGLRAGSGSWEFSGDVPEKFADHVRHSVPSYDAGHDVACDLATCFVGGEGRGVAYELGSATGLLLRWLATYGPTHQRTRWIGVDREPGMVTAAREHCHDLDNVELLCDELTSTRFEPCDFVVAYLTVHFVPLDRRPDVVARIHDALRPGGGFFLFDKVLAPDAHLEDLVTTLHYRWKRRAGPSPEEILNKKESLLGVLQPTSTEANVAMLHDAGFHSVGTVFKHLCFEGFAAIK